ncbi:hypothetical protein [Niallia sp. Krafla_26]|uniref:hypothetical protein n=1 Tax=Niallia sp. Krafla_26 TaxID=3064703 RepID=UPI003D173414
MLTVLDAKVENPDVEKRTYQLVLNFGHHQSNVRLFCKEENNKTKVMLVAVMEGRCPCCGKPNCPSLSQRGDELLAQVCELDAFKAKASAGESLVF